MFIAEDASALLADATGVDRELLVALVARGAKHRLAEEFHLQRDLATLSLGNLFGIATMLAVRVPG